MKTYNKLVRDQIPNIIVGQDKKVNFKILEDHEAILFFNKKLEEELNEYLNSTDSEQLSELADIVEVIYGILELKKISIPQFESMRIEKKEIRGGFSKKILLIAADE